MSNDIGKLAVLIQRCHSILATAWPKPGVAALAGSKQFIPTNVFRALAAGVSQTSVELFSTENAALGRMWSQLQQLIRLLMDVGERTDDQSVDEMVNALYFATGVAFHFIGGYDTLEDRDSCQVEPFLTLITVCQWPSDEKTQSVDTILQSVESRLADFVRMLAGIRGEASP